ncbi:hypothetical protein BAY61_32195 (plasmid) [Prauserella marina]|uniref:DUF8175 domain-containing protein n=1 Tax=Prauserella marina TaxID=530584 RepID=A0A222W1C8_9PSEU|nr:hypothetical protein [Prauserella marina]ASR39945.1 hypothetical protein BAY61_32195 [Prauserella marina]PWV71448.1 hypothetical protein DES30_112164 [Prauserella marina]SDD97439.1 hypothetical protein SAMN05421630_115115 [Prauserella marina]
MVSLDNPPSARRGKRIALVVVGVLVVAALAVAAFLLGRDTSGESTPPPPATSAPASSDAAVPAQPPEGVRWQRYQGVLLPLSDVHGPRQNRDGVATGFAHTSEGALLALVNIYYRVTLAPGEQWREIAEQQIVGAGQQDFVEQMSHADRSALPSPPPVAGFRVVSFDESTAVITLVVGSPGGYIATTEVMRWADGDWRYALDSATPSPPQRLSSLEGYVPWNGS